MVLGLSCHWFIFLYGANRVLDVPCGNTQVQHVDHLKYLEVSLDRSLTYNTYLTKSTNWGTSAKTLRKALLALVYSTAEYCSAPVWLNSVRVSKIDVQYSGTIKSTQLQCLPCRTSEHRHIQTVRELVNYRRHARSLL
jgi:hypothetical protein